MTEESTDFFRELLFESIKERLLDREDVEIPGLGIFRTEHIPSRMTISSDLDTPSAARAESVDFRSLLPPEDCVRFESGSKL